MKLYIFADLLNQGISITAVNFWAWGNPPEDPTLYQTSEAAFRLIETREIDLSGIKFDFFQGKIQALEAQLGDLHVKSENIKAQIQELKCIGHDSIASKDEPFDHDIPF